MKRQVVIPAGGLGRRLGEPLPKALVPLCGVPLLLRTLAVFDRMDLARNAVIAIPETHRNDFQSVLDEAYPGHRITLVHGGAERQDSVRLGLAALDGDTKLCAVHDAARPFVPVSVVEASFQEAQAHGAATVAVPAIDTVLVADEGGFLQDTPDRATVWYCQTPQTFAVECIRSAHEKAHAGRFAATDDATLARWSGHPVKLVKGVRENIKVTTPTDMLVAETFIERGVPCE